MNTLSHLPDSSRIWIYTAARPLTVEEQEYTCARLENFIPEWAAHGTNLNAAFELLHKRFIVIAVDEEPQNATGCSIDSCVHELQDIGKTLNLDFFDRMNVVYRDEDNNMVVSCKLGDLKTMVEEDDFHGATLVFDTTIQTLGELRTRFEVTAERTWMKRFLNKVDA